MQTLPGRGSPRGRRGARLPATAAAPSEHDVAAPPDLRPRSREPDRCRPRPARLARGGRPGHGVRPPRLRCLR
ncbi:hypothetical protein CTI14_19405, partial [Methylobacterium radiotolerans]